MAVVLLVVVLVGLLLIATEALNRINKAAVAMCMGVVCWLLFIAYGREFLTACHPTALAEAGGVAHADFDCIKQFIASSVFFKYIVKSANIVLFLLATTSIVEVLSNNGCFDFLNEWLRTRKPRKLMWLLAFFTFVLSANLDNLCTVVLLLTIMHPLLRNEKQRRVYGAVIVLAANCGGAITVIGDLTSLKLWDEGLVTASEYFLIMALPVTAALATMLLLLTKNLPTRVELALDRLPYRGDDTLLTRPQRLLMLFVGIGGLWFIPTFHRITLLPPFVGAFCVLALLWMVNELCNHRLMGSDKMVLRRLPMALQYANLQNLLYFVGLTLAFGALAETGLLAGLSSWMAARLDNVYLLGVGSAVLAALFGNLPALMAGISVCGGSSALPEMAADGAFWHLLSYTTAMGGSLLLTASVSGVLLMRMEGMTFGWYFRHVMPKVLAGFAAGFAVMAALLNVIYD